MYTKQPHWDDASLTTTPFIYLCLTTKVYWYRPTLLRHFLKRAIQDMCCSCKWGLFWQDPRTWGSGGKCIPGPTFQGLVVVFPVENEAVKKKKEFCANRASGHQFNCHFPFRFFFHVSGMVWIIVQSVICPFHGCLMPEASSHSHLFPYLQLSLYNWMLSKPELDTRLLAVTHKFMTAASYLLL